MADAATKPATNPNEKDWVEPKTPPAQLKDHEAISRPMAPEKAKRPSAADATINLPGTARSEWEVFVDHTHTPEDIVDPLYWGERIADVQPGDYLNVEPNDGAWLATIRVMEIDKAAGRVIVEPAGKLVTFRRVPPPDGFKIAFVSRTVGFRVERVISADESKVLRSGFKSYQGALAFLIGSTGDAPARTKKD